MGVGRYDGAPGATAELIFTDAGEPGRSRDFAAIRIRNAAGQVVLDVAGTLDQGNYQALGNCGCREDRGECNQPCTASRALDINTFEHWGSKTPGQPRVFLGRNEVFPDPEGRLHILLFDTLGQRIRDLFDAALVYSCKGQTAPCCGEMLVRAYAPITGCSALPCRRN